MTKIRKGKKNVDQEEEKGDLEALPSFDWEWGDVDWDDDDVLTYKGNIFHYLFVILWIRLIIDYCSRVSVCRCDFHAMWIIIIVLGFPCDATAFVFVSSNQLLNEWIIRLVLEIWEFEYCSFILVLHFNLTSTRCVRSHFRNFKLS